MRAVAALLVVGTHAAFATGQLTHGYLGGIYARLEIGVAIFFVLSGFLLFRPWVLAAASGTPPPQLTRYTRNRLRRIMPGYLVAVLATFAVYTVFTPGPNPGQTWDGLLRYLTLTQVYTDNFLATYLHPGLSQMWSLAVEVSFYAVLPGLAYVLLRVRRPIAWRPVRTLTGLAALGAVAPAWLLIAHTTDALPKRGRHVAARTPCVFRRRHGIGSPEGHRSTLARPGGVAVGGGAVPDRVDTGRRGDHRTRSRLGAGHQIPPLRRHRDARGGAAGSRFFRPVCADAGQ